MSTAFIPPFPNRPIQKLGALETLLQARKDPLSIWSEDAFSVQFRAVKILNRHLFIANCPEIVRHILETQHANYEQKSTAMQKALEPLLGDSLLLSAGEAWHSRRQLLATLFSEQQVACHVPVIAEVVAACRNRWLRLAPGAEIAVLPEMASLSMGIICRLLFGGRWAESQTTEVLQAFTAYQTAIEQIDIGGLLGLPGWFSGFRAGQTKRAAQGIHQLIDAAIAEEMLNPRPGSMLALLLDANDRGGQPKMSPQQLRNELITLIIAGYETTANTLAWAWYLISQRPDVEVRLHEEIDRVLEGRSPAYEDVSRLVYTRAIVDETLRLYPPLPVLSRQAKTEDIIRNRTIPAGSTMLVVPWLLHRHKLYWEQPDHFLPERFLPDAETKYECYAYIPFGSGARVCLGKSLAIVETVLGIAMLAQKFRLRLPPLHQLTHECRLTLRPKGHVPMRLELR
ncbi:MAG: cytochrome P450 [Gammaproteobacteria bacterium]